MAQVNNYEAFIDNLTNNLIDSLIWKKIEVSIFRHDHLMYGIDKTEWDLPTSLLNLIDWLNVMHLEQNVFNGEERSIILTD